MIQAMLIDGEHRTLINWPAEQEQRRPGTVVWLDLFAPAAEEMEQVAKAFALHPAVVRACLHPEHRAKIKEYQDHVLIVLNAVGRGLSEKGDRSEIGRWRTLELNLVVGNGYLITTHPEPVPAVTLLWQRYGKEAEGRPTAEYLVYSLVESVTSGYHLVMDRLDKLIDQVETAIFTGHPPRTVVDQLYTLKRHVLYLRRVLGPQRDALGSLMRRDLAIFPPESRSYFLELYEHTLRLFDMMDTYRDLISSSLDAYLSTVSNHMNEIMKTLTIVSTILLPLSLLSGIFGMNVGGLPLNDNPNGFWILVLIMLGIGAATYAMFKRRKWL